MINNGRKEYERIWYTKEPYKLENSYDLVMLDTLILWSLLHFTTLSFGWTLIKFPTAAFHLTFLLKSYWRKNWVKCAVLTGNSAGLRTDLSIRLSHTELRSSLKESHSFLSLPADTTIASSQGNEQNWKKNWQKTDKPDGKAVLCQRTFSPVSCAVFYTVKLHSLT
jgi:hypothetical protein